MSKYCDTIRVGQQMSSVLAKVISTKTTLCCVLSLKGLTFIVVGNVGRTFRKMVVHQTTKTRIIRIKIFRASKAKAANGQILTYSNV